MEDIAVEENEGGKFPWKWIVLGLVVVALLVARQALPLGDWLASFNTWVGQMGCVGMLVFAAVYVIATVLFLPGAILTLGSGFIFGLVWGTVVVSIGSTVGAALAFLVARYLARDWVAEKAQRHPKFRAIDRAVGQEGWKIVGLLRLSPAIPFNLSNYIYGLTSVSFWPYVLASWIGMLPGTVMYVYLGVAGRAGIQAAAGDQVGRSPAEYGFLSLGLLATVFVTLLVTRAARKALKQVEADEVSPPASAGK